jgi:hypothetical protein
LNGGGQQNGVFGAAFFGGQQAGGLPIGQLAFGLLRPALQGLFGVVTRL